MRQGEIWTVCLDPVVGAEIRKTRPALIISVDVLGKLPLKIIVPITDWKEHYESYPWMVKIEPDLDNGLSKISAIDTFQIRSISVERMVQRLGAVGKETIFSVQEGIGKVVGLE